MKKTEEQVMSELDQALENGFDNLTPRNIYELCADLQDVISKYREKIKLVDEAIQQIVEFKDHLQALNASYKFDMETGFIEDVDVDE